MQRDAAGDQELIAGWRAGDESDAAELVRRHAGAVAGFLRGAGAEDDELEDLVQETLFRAFRRLETFQGGASFRTWLLSIASNLLKDTWRRRRGRTVISLDDREVVDGGADPGAEAEARHLEERFRRGVRGLPRLQRDVFLLRAQQGAGYDEIAAALGTTAGAARVHYHHAVKRLKQLLD